MNENLKKDNLEIFSGEYDEEINKLPHYMREKIAKLIDQTVEERVDQYMEVFRQEIEEEL